MTLTLRKTLALFLILALGACQATPVGMGSNTNDGFHIQGNSKPGLRPLVECIAANRDGSFTAFFGYENTTGKTVTIPVGDKNKFLENPGQGRQNDKHDNADKDRDNKNQENDKEHVFSTKSSKENKDQNKDKDEHDQKNEKDKEDHGKNEDNRHSNQDRGQPTVFPVGRSQAWPNSPLAVVFNQ